MHQLHRLQNPLLHNRCTSLVNENRTQAHRLYYSSLHCDILAGSYIWIESRGIPIQDVWADIMDGVFGPELFRTEITWKRTSAHSDTKQGRQQHGRVHDLILFYSKSESWTWNPIYTEYDQEYIDQFYRHIEPETGRRYRLGDLTGPGGAAKGIIEASSNEGDVVLDRFCG